MTNEHTGDILTSTTNGIGTLTISNPKLRNAMNLAMYKKVPSAIDSLIASGATVTRGAGDDAFGAGSDISEFETLRTPDNAHAYDDAEADAHESIEKSPVPTVAMINGPCRGGGLAIALACDLRYASDTATFAAPPAKLGIAFPHPAVTSLAKPLETHTPATFSSQHQPLTPKKHTASDSSITSLQAQHFPPQLMI